MPAWAPQHATRSPAWTHGFVNLNPAPRESHRIGIQVDEAFARFVVAFDLSASLRRSGEVRCFRLGMAAGGNRSEAIMKRRRPLAIRDL